MSCAGQVLFAVNTFPNSKGAFASAVGTKAFPTSLILGDAVNRENLGLDTATDFIRISSGFLWQNSGDKEHPRFIFTFVSFLYFIVFHPSIKQFLGLFGMFVPGSPSGTRVVPFPAMEFSLIPARQTRMRLLLLCERFLGVPNDSREEQLPLEQFLPGGCMS